VKGAYKLNKELNTAIFAAKEAGKIQLELRESSLNIERKADRSPVTHVDKICENKILEIILNEFPHDSFLGEESGVTGSSETRRWIVDPIDGTRPYIRGIPTHSVLIALEENNEPIIGVIYLPDMDIICHAAKGEGAFLNGEKISVSSTNKLSGAMGSTLGLVEYADEPLGRGMLSLMRAWDYTYGFMDAYSYVLLASGKLDVCVNLLDKAWDCAAAACIVTEAGGQFSDISGKKTVHNGSIVFTNGILHDQTLKFFEK
jgi:histidinol phosphatase-like enzyme (inositol monophosphatase family)